MKNKQERAAVLISLKPCFAEAILRGEKTIECRKTSIQMPESGRILLYAASPVKQLVGEAIIENIVSMNPLGIQWKELWKSGSRQIKGINDNCNPFCLSLDEFNDYYNDCKIGVFIYLKNAVRYARPRSLAELRSITPPIHPPQQHRYLSAWQLEQLGL